MKINQQSAEQIKKILQFWHKVEFFLPFDLDKNVLDKKGAEKTLRKYRSETLITETQPLWAVKCPQGEEVLGFQVYLGIFDKSEITLIADKVVKHKLNDVAVFDQSERNAVEGLTCFAKISINPSGILNFDELSISTVPWALGLIQSKGIEALNFEKYLADFDNLKKTIKEFRTSRGNLILKGSDLIDLQKIFYEWAGFSPKKSDKQFDVIISTFFGNRRDKASIKTSEDEPEIEISILNSFYARDIEIVLCDLKSGNTSSPLLNYLIPLPVAKRIDLYKTEGKKFLEEELSPKNINKGHWLEDPNNGMSLMQQFAINQISKTLHKEGIFSVNGPPGTGKTTMLKDIFAENITGRARQLSKLSASSKAFKGSTRIEFKDTSWTVNLLNDELAGYEMVVASSNNAAVENISLDLPKHSSLGKETWGISDTPQSFQYLKQVAHKIAAEDSKRFKTLKTQDEPWGLISSVFGRKQNRQAFMSKLLNPTNNNKEYNVDGYNPEHYQSLGIWKDRYEGPTFLEARNAFKNKDDLVINLINDLEKLATFAGFFKKNTFESFTLQQKIQLKEASSSLQISIGNHNKIQIEILDAEDEIALIKNEHEALKINKPAWYAIILQRKKLKNYAKANKDLKEKLNTKDRHARRLAINQNKAANEIAQNTKAVEEAKKLLNQKLKSWEEKQAEFKNLSDKFPKAFGFTETDVESEDSQINGLWKDEKLNMARSELFAAALKLHEAWLHEVLSKHGFMANLWAFNTLMAGKQLLDRTQAVYLWQSLFMVVPIISSTFASISSQFRDLKSEAIGWLFIDEAGQAVPQAAVGALWRSKRAVVVGDPLQVEPVFTVPINLIETLHQYSSIPESTNVKPNQVSVQILADQANSVGTLIDLNNGKAQWIGSPLRVHRRCVNPMFDIANYIAYNDKMIFGLRTRFPPAKSLDLGPSAWVDVAGSVTNKQSVEEQSNLVLNALIALYKRTKSLPPLYIISPFKAIKFDLNEKISNIKNWEVSGHDVPQNKDLKDWCKDNIGTVHTFQGKENSIVWIVLGCDGTSQGAVNWACASPNLLNVAVTRAQHRLFILGDVNVWGNKEFFKMAKRELPTINSLEFIQRMNCPQLIPPLKDIKEIK